MTPPQLLRTLIPLLSFAHLLTIVNAQISEADILTSFRYPGMTPFMFAEGDAVISEKYINLTRTDDSGNPATDSVGRVVYGDPVDFTTFQGNTSFVAIIRFKITPREGSRGDFSLVGDGLAFFITTRGGASNIPVGSSGGNLGIYNSSGMSRYPTFAVEFDTDPNPWDPRYMHVGINIGSRTSRNVTRVDTSIVDKEVTAAISYEPATNLIGVGVEADSKVFSVSYVYNLSSIFRDNRVEVGISAATGAFTAKHDVLHWRFKSVSEP